MYSLPITTYSDYWRRTRLWSAYFGSVAVLVAGSRYSSIGDPSLGKTTQAPLHAVKSLSFANIRAEELNETGLLGLESRRELARQGLTKQGQISRGIEAPNQKGQEVLISEQETMITSKVEIIHNEIPFETQYIETEELAPGTSQVQAKGEKGTSREVIKTFEVGGQPVDQHVQSFYELKSPQKEVILQNTKPLPKKKVVIQKPTSEDVRVDIDLSTLKIRNTLSVEATAYTYTGNNTATGIKPREGLIAVDPKVIAMGSKVYVEGYGYAIAADTGGSIRGNRIDVFFSTLRQCIDWGRKPVRIYILDGI